MSAAVPVMITKAMESKLADLGFTPSEISKLTPEQAWDFIRAEAHSPASPDESTELLDMLGRDVLADLEARIESGAVQLPEDRAERWAEIDRGLEMCQRTAEQTLARCLAKLEEIDKELARREVSKTDPLRAAVREVAEETRRSKAAPTSMLQFLRIIEMVDESKIDGGLNTDQRLVLLCLAIEAQYKPDYRGYVGTGARPGNTNLMRSTGKKRSWVLDRIKE